MQNILLICKPVLSFFNTAKTRSAYIHCILAAMKRLIFFTLIIFCSGKIHAQRISQQDYSLLQKQEDSLAYFSKKIIFDTVAVNRFRYDTIFIKQFVKALQTPHSFYYTFDSLITVSIIYPPDSSFRIFSWQVQRDENYFRQYGAIQMNTADGSLKLFPLFDASDFSSTPTDSVRNCKNWIGALYYFMLQKEYKNKKYYTLFGYDDNDFISTKKWIEVLSFDAQGNPVFGGNFFDYPDDELKPPQPVSRFCLEYKKDGGAKIMYDADLDMILFDHLVSESDEANKRYTLIPDGDPEGFKWKNGKWVYVNKVFNSPALKDGQAPRPEPLFDIDEKKP